jgi:ferredoxin hydrogenase small subunit
MALLDRGATPLPRELAAAGIRLLWHPSLSEATGSDVIVLFDRIAAGSERLDILCIEGAILCGPNGSGRFNRLAGTDRTMMDLARDLAAQAGQVVAVGSCAAYGGAPAAGDNPTDARGLQFSGAASGGVLGRDFRSRLGLPVVNVAGCAPHPGWIVETLQALALDGLEASDLDALGRPRFFADHLAHHGCSRNEFYEFKASAESLSQRGCLMEHLGCRATQAVGDCNQRSWNGGGSCTHAGFACIACTAPDFEQSRSFQETPKVAGIPVGLPLDMPKAWFVALAALSKSATPKRVRTNAGADHVVVAPDRAPKGPK